MFKFDDMRESSIIVHCYIRTAVVSTPDSTATHSMFSDLTYWHFLLGIFYSLVKSKECIAWIPVPSIDIYQILKQWVKVTVVSPVTVSFSLAYICKNWQKKIDRNTFCYQNVPFLFYENELHKIGFHVGSYTQWGYIYSIFTTFLHSQLSPFL